MALFYHLCLKDKKCCRLRKLRADWSGSTLSDLASSSSNIVHGLLCSIVTLWWNYGCLKTWNHYGTCTCMLPIYRLQAQWVWPLRILPEMSQVKETIDLLTRVLRGNGTSKIKAETFRLAKFDKDEAVSLVGFSWWILNNYSVIK